MQGDLEDPIYASLCNLFRAISYGPYHMVHIYLLVNWSETLTEIRRFDVINFMFSTAGVRQELGLPDYEINYL